LPGASFIIPDWSLVRPARDPACQQQGQGSIDVFDPGGCDLFSPIRRDSTGNEAA